MAQIEVQVLEQKSAYGKYERVQVASMRIDAGRLFRDGEFLFLTNEGGEKNFFRVLRVEHPFHAVTFVDFGAQQPETAWMNDPVVVVVERVNELGYPLKGKP